MGSHDINVGNAWLPMVSPFSHNQAVCHASKRVKGNREIRKLYANLFLDLVTFICLWTYGQFPNNCLSAIMIKIKINSYILCHVIKTIYIFCLFT